MNVSLIAIISLGSPAYVYDPYPVHTLYPEPAYEVYDPYYEEPLYEQPYYEDRYYEEPYYAEPYYEPAYYRPHHRSDLGDVLLTVFGVALLGSIFDADVDFVIGAPYYPRYQPYGYPVVYRPRYVYDPWYYRPAYCYDPWYPPSIVVSNYWGDPYYHCSPDRYVGNNYYEEYS